MKDYGGKEKGGKRTADSAKGVNKMHEGRKIKCEGEKQRITEGK